MAGIDTNRTTDGINLPAEVSNEVWGLTIKDSAVMQAARRINIPGSGVQVDMLTGVGDAAWVNETDEKPVGSATFSNKTLRPYMLAIILPFSNQFRRDLPGLYNEIIRVLPAELGRKFDSTVFGSIAAPGSDFDQLDGAQAIELADADAFGSLLAARAAVGVRPSHWITGAELETTLLGAKDVDGTRPFVADFANDASIGRIFGAPVLGTDGTFAGTDQGIVGDFAGNAVWGSVEGIQFSISDQSTLNIEGEQVNLWQRNMFAVRFEIEAAFGVRDLTKFARIQPDAVDPDPVDPDPVDPDA